MELYSSWKWVRCKTVSEDLYGAIVMDEPGEEYGPFAFPNLPNAFAKVDNEDSAIAFALSWGLLGYSHLIRDETYLHTEVVPTLGDPLPWVLAQASSVRFALNLIRALDEKDEESALAVLIEHSTVVHAVDVHDLSYLVSAHVITEGIVQVQARFRREEWVGRYLLEAAKMLTRLVNNNTEGISWKLSCDESTGTIAQDLGFNALIEVIWYQVARLAISAQEQKGQIVRICRQCQIPFMATDRRQQFCPPEIFPRQDKSKRKPGSLCGARYRMNKMNKMRKGDGDNG